MSGDAAIREALWRAVTRDGITDAEGGNEAVDNLLPIVTAAIAEAEKRGAVKALRWLADGIKGSRPDPVTRDLAATIHADARRIESGEVTP